MKRAIILLVALIGLACLTDSRGQAGGERYITFSYGGSQRFGVSVLKDPQGKPVNKQLTYDTSGRTNSTLIRFDGKQMEFGDSNGKWLEKGTATTNPSKSVWSIGGVEISQILEIRPGKTGLMDTLLVRYVNENKDGAAHKIGLRAMMDSAIGSSSNDGVPYTVAGSSELVTTFKDFPGSVPEWVEALEFPNVQKPGTIAHMTLRLGGSIEPPSRASITYWSGTTQGTYDVPLKNIKSDGRNDSCIVMYWNEQSLAPGAKRDVGYAYGTATAPSADPTKPGPTGGGDCPKTFTREWVSDNFGKIKLTVGAGGKLSAIYANRHGKGPGAWSGTVSSDGTKFDAIWKDDTGGQQGTITATLNPNGCGWTGYWNTTNPPPGPTQGVTAVDPNAPGGGAGPTGAAPPGNPWDTPQGQACFEKWIALVTSRLNAYDAGPKSNHNLRKPWGFNQYGILIGKGISSAGAPDNFPQYKNNKYWWMWDQYIPTGTNVTWKWPEWNATNIPSIRDFVTRCYGETIGPTGGGPGGTGPGGVGPGGCCAPVPGNFDRMTLQAPELQVTKDQEVLVPIWLIKGTDVANLNWTLTYDPSVAVPVGVVTKGNLLGGLFEYNTNESGIIRFGVAQTAAINGTGTVAYVRFRAVGPPGSKTRLTLAVSSINSPSGTPLQINLVHGFIEIIDPSRVVPGDCDGDGALTILDAQCALKMSVRLIPERRAMDMDNDSQVTSRDAVIILQQVTRLVRN